MGLFITFTFIVTNGKLVGFVFLAFAGVRVPSSASFGNSLAYQQAREYS